MFCWKVLRSIRPPRLVPLNYQKRTSLPSALAYRPWPFRFTSTLRSNFVYNRKSSFKEIASETAFIFFAISFYGCVVLLFYPVGSPYKTLGSDARFRILILEPGKGQEVLIYSLKHVSSLQTEEYEAISYAWGDDTPDGEDTFCNGMVFRISSNLAAALYRLRDPKKTRALWADAICINQDDWIEKAGQVPLMRDIYTHARKVIIWLGKESSSDKDALELLRRLSAHFHQQDGELGNPYLQQTHDHGLPQDDVALSDIFKKFVALLSREWFNRTWVIQEVACAQKAVVMCGAESIPWEVLPDLLASFSDLFFSMHRMEAGKVQQSLENIIAIEINHLEKSSKTRHSLQNILAMERARRSVNGTFSLSLFEILLATCFNDCSDPRDKIFAVLGLAKDWLEKGGLTPDYRQATTVEQVYGRFAMWDVKKNGKIRILSCVAGRDETPDMPSWVPDWRHIENSNPFVRYSDRTMFAASKGTFVDAWYSDHGRILNVMGRVVDSIKVTGSEPRFRSLVAQYPSTEDNIEQLKRTQAWLKECLNYAMDSDTGMSAERYNQFWRTMTCGLTSNAFPAPAEYGSYFKNYLEFIESATSERIPTTEHKNMKSSLPESRVLSDDNPDLQTHAAIESSLEEWSSGRRFCTTSKERLGFVPMTAQKGDLICILGGGEVPYVLRPHSSGRYTVVGECYVDGIMHGEAFSDESYLVKRFELL